jgi:hypothetical protein
LIFQSQDGALRVGVVRDFDDDLDYLSLEGVHALDKTFRDDFSVSLGTQLHTVPEIINAKIEGQSKTGPDEPKMKYEQKKVIAHNEIKFARQRLNKCKDIPEIKTVLDSTFYKVTRLAQGYPTPAMLWATEIRTDPHLTSPRYQRRTLYRGPARYKFNDTNGNGGAGF